MADTKTTGSPAEWMMMLALRLAERGRSFVSPNPMVGAVLAERGKVIATGYHRQFGGPHAEVEALERAGAKARNADLYVTMEPCCFCGKTGACTDRLIHAGIRHVYAATTDPHPNVRGRGARCLRKAGIGTSVGLLAADARRLNEAYFTYHQKQRPFVTLKLALSFDGMVGTRRGESKWITGPKARSRGQSLRQAADSIVVGVETVLCDDPRLDCLAKRRRPLAKVVLDSELRTPPVSRFIRTSGPAIVMTGSLDRKRRRRLEAAGAEVVYVGPAQQGLLPWNGVLAELYQREMMSVLVEGGARVAGSLLDSGFADKVCLFHAPLIIGPGRSFGAAMKNRGLARALKLKHTHHEIIGNDIMTTGYLG